MDMRASIASIATRPEKSTAWRDAGPKAAPLFGCHSGC
jgi:hypothetical protein